MVYVPLEAIAYKYYGESERHLADIFAACDGRGECLVFLDEVNVP
jgi:SpoVK/Ycf46/Vps4 family AAA+-type ATPase